MMMLSLIMITMQSRLSGDWGRCRLNDARNRILGAKVGVHHEYTHVEVGQQRDDVEHHQSCDRIQEVDRVLQEGKRCRVIGL